MHSNSSKVANYFLDLAEKEGHSFTTLKLVKMVYIAHGWSLSTLGVDILNGEQVQAWQHGPVIPSIYHEFKIFGKRPITSRATEIEFTTVDNDPDDYSISSVIPMMDESEAEIIEVLKFVWNVYKQYSAFDLVNLTHKPDTPWSQSYSTEVRNRPIENSLIETFYTEQVSTLLSAANQ